MIPADARSRPLPQLLPPAERLITPLPLNSPPPAQAMLPWSRGGPEVSAPRDAIEPDARQRAVALTVAVTEALRGRRSVTQLERWVDAPVLALVSRLQHSHPYGDLRVKSVRLQAPTLNCIEVSARLGHGTNSLAAALRITRELGRWRCVALEIAVTPAVIHRAA